MDPSRLRDLGWDAFFDDGFAPHSGDGLVPARVAVQHRGEFVLYTAAGEIRAVLAGRLRGDHVIRIPGKLAYADPIGGRLPTVGDWVAVATRPGEERGTIQAILPRRTEFSRKAPLVTQRQVLAANIDTVFVVAALIADTGESSARRLQRRARSRGLAAYLAMAHRSGTQPVILLTKADLLADPATAASEHAELGAPVIVTSTVTGRGLDLVGEHVTPGRTAALIGSSGVGKSSLTNALLGTDLLPTQEVRRDGEGRHTTVDRELIRLPGRGMVIDTPGLRQLDLWDADEGIDGGFADIEDLAERCHFRDCRHEADPGCAVLAAIADGSLDRSRLVNSRRLQRELERLDRRQEQLSRAFQQRRQRRQRRLRTSAHFDEADRPHPREPSE